MKEHDLIDEYEHKDMGKRKTALGMKVAKTGFVLGSVLEAGSIVQGNVTGMIWGAGLMMANLGLHHVLKNNNEIWDQQVTDVNSLLVHEAVLDIDIKKPELPPQV